jgi:hypothetical protein
MSKRPNDQWNRREFLTNAALAGTGALLGLQSNSLAAEPPPETTKLRLIRGPSICQAPQTASEELLRSEGFTDVQEVKKEGNITARIQAWPREKATSSARTSPPSSLELTQVIRSSSLRAHTPGALSCLEPIGFARFATSKGKPSP